ncbi:endodeoxyribonuclease [Lauvirus lau218]|uniref:Endodeoxyribonuclease n=1 Tax=Lauvirus lau218 TaxID=1465639 RepID=A0A060BL03_9CAUD|nr:endodeoxyribonuclease [Lauvirus lau218]
MYKLTLPYPTIKKKKSLNLLSLNIYRNAHFFLLSKAKKEYAELCFAEFKKHKLVPLKGQIMLKYTLFFKGKRRRDLDNFFSITSKFFNDALVDYGIIEDDDTKVIPNIEINFGGTGDKNYVQIEILQLTK